MIDFLIKHKLTNPSQHGFLKAKSCLTNLLFFGRNNEWVDDGSPVDVLSCTILRSTAFCRLSNDSQRRITQRTDVDGAAYRLHGPQKLAGIAFNRESEPV